MYNEYAIRLSSERKIDGPSMLIIADRPRRVDMQVTMATETPMIRSCVASNIIARLEHTVLQRYRGDSLRF
jgi:hypothetical protein